MPSLVFHRTGFDELWITITSNETLSVLDTAYVEDYFGVDGQLTLHNMTTDVRTPFVMTEDIDETPLTPHDVFIGVVDLTGLPDGTYRVEGRVRDILGNYRILSDFFDPLGTEDVTLYEILITPVSIVVLSPKQAQIFQVLKPEADVMQLETPYAAVQLIELHLSVGINLLEKPSGDIMLLEKPEGQVMFIATPEIDILNVYTI
jgi:hypothetical protein